MTPVKGARVLVVEDDEDVRETLLRILEDFGYDAVGASDGHEALAQLRLADAPRPALMLVDLRMPRMDGRRLHEEMERDVLLRGIPTIVLSADGKLISRGQLPGAVAVVSKPVPLDKLLGLIEQVLSRPPL